jgi:hypothetical protein
MGHFFEEVWRFKGLGLLWAVLIAAFLFGLRELIKYLAERKPSNEIKIDEKEYKERYLKEKIIKDEEAYKLLLGQEGYREWQASLGNTSVSPKKEPVVKKKSDPHLMAQRCQP